VLCELGPRAGPPKRPPPPRQDLQEWNEADLYGRVISDVSTTFVFLDRFSQQQPNPGVQSAGVDVNFTLSKTLTVTASYYYIAFPLANKSPGYNSVPIAALTWSRTFGRWMLSDRNRFDGVFGSGPNYGIYQNRLRVDMQLRQEVDDVKIFAWNEVSYYGMVDAWSRDRSAAGIELPAGKNCSVDVYGLHQVDTSSTRRVINALGLAIVLKAW
jgi:hypothetical protein